MDTRINLIPAMWMRCRHSAPMSLDHRTLSQFLKLSITDVLAYGRQGDPKFQNRMDYRVEHYYKEKSYQTKQ